MFFAYSVYFSIDASDLDFVEGLGDATGGHGSWVPNSAATASSNVFANGK